MSRIRPACFPVLALFIGCGGSHSATEASSEQIEVGNQSAQDTRDTPSPCTLGHLSLANLKACLCDGVERRASMERAGTYCGDGYYGSKHKSLSLELLSGQVSAGDSVDVTLKITNHTSSPAPLVLRVGDSGEFDGWGLTGQRLAATNERGELVVWGGDCGVGQSSVNRDFLIMIPAASTLEEHLTWTAQQRMRAPDAVGDCPEIESRPLPKGDYTLSILAVEFMGINQPTTKIKVE